jgi:hypothetical protein
MVVVTKGIDSKGAVQNGVKSRTGEGHYERLTLDVQCQNWNWNWLCTLMMMGAVIKDDPGEHIFRRYLLSISENLPNSPISSAPECESKG